MPLPIGSRQIPSVIEKDPVKLQFFEEVKFRLDNMGAGGGASSPPPQQGTITQALSLTGSGITASSVIAYKAVTTDTLGQIIHADSSSPQHSERILGIALNSAGAGQEVTYLSAGDVSNEGWNWTVGSPIFLSSNGGLTHNPNTGVFQIQLGFAKTATKITVSIGMAIHH